MNKASASKNTRQPSSTKTHKPMPLSLHLARVFKESGLIIVIGFALFMALSVWSYDSGDPGWSHAGSHTKITNMIGFVGAWIADFIVSFIGWVAWLVPIMLLGSSVRFLVRRYVGIIDAIPYFMMRFTGALIFVMGATTLCAIHLSNMHINFPFTAGGLIGHALSDYLIQFFSVYGTTLLAWMMVLFGLTLYMEMSWLAIIEWTGKTLLGLCALFPKILDIQWPTLRLPRFSIPAVKMPQIKAPFVKTSAMNSQKPRDLHNTALNNSPFSDTPFSDTPFSDTTRSNTALNNTSSSNRAMYKTPPDRAVVENSLNKVTVRRMDPVEPTFDLNSFEHEADPFDKAISLTETFAADSSDSPLQTSRNTQLPPASQPRTAAQARPVTTDSVVASPSPSSSLSDRSAVQPLESQQTQTADLMQKTETATKIVSQAPQSVQPEHLATQGATIKGTRVVATQPSKHMRLPSLDLLDKPDPNRIDQGYTDEEMEDMSRLLEAKLNDFGVVAVVEEVSPGPVITRFEIQPAAGVKASKITNLASDLARSMTVSSVRIVEVIPGKSTIGVEIPNQSRQVVYLSQVIDSDPFRKAHSKLTMALGHDISGNPVVTDLAKMPHLLVAGTTGSGKSVGVNAMLVSLLFKAKPDEVRLILVDPKMLELSIYEGIPHLLTPVITDMKEAAGGLRWCVAEMERRYKLMAKLGVRNIAGYNEKVVNADAQGQPIPDPFWRAEDYGLSRDELPPPLTKLPYIVVVIDEFADMMMVVGKKVEELIARIAQKARAAGIHLILATQRPSVDVITGLIKANVPTRMAFQVSSKIDSRTILDQAGAENLLGHGDMLFLPAGTSIPVRVHGAFVSDDDVHRTVEAWKTVAPPNYLDEIVATMSFDEGGSLGADSGGGADDEQDALYDEAVAFVLESRKASISAVQRKLKIGYNRAARMIETMENAGVVSSAGSNGQREVLAPEPHKD